MELDLYANLRPSKMFPGIKSRYEDIDLIVVRENTEDLYSVFRSRANGWNRCSGKHKNYNRKASERIVRFAFDYARDNGRKKVTVVHKANILKLSDGLFLEIAREIAGQYPSLEFEDRIVDNMGMQLVQKPEQYDVMVMPNLYGDILSDLCASLVGGLGVVPGANIGDQAALFEPVHGSAPKYAGKNYVNPSAMIMAVLLMLRHMEEREAADRIEKALTA